ncbi:NAD-P-binding protein [Dentipellis sp. KUC8613]|nr:NAD-P-binding protein [Dentipellis sp. KUC8613]
MTPFKSFAIAGIGSVGAPLAEELLKQRGAGKVREVVLLTRSLSQSSNNKTLERLASHGARIAEVDYASEESIIAALHGVTVVISTVSHMQLHVQPTLATAAKKAGVRLFVPSEYGDPTDVAETGVLKVKRDFHATLRELDLPYLLTFTGPLTDFILVPYFHIDFENGTATVGGDGNAANSFTYIPDLARFLAYVLTHLTPDQLYWKTLRIEGDRISFNEIFKQYTAKTGKKIAVSYQSLPELQAALKANPYDVASYLSSEWAQGGGLVGKSEELSNGLYPDWNPKKVIDVITQ